MIGRAGDRNDQQRRPEAMFVFGEARQWVLEHEETVVAGRTEPLVMSHEASHVTGLKRA